MLAEFADAGFVNVVGGCCGTTPAHIGHRRGRRRQGAAADAEQMPPLMRLSGLEPSR